MVCRLSKLYIIYTLDSRLMEQLFFYPTLLVTLPRTYGKKGTSTILKNFAVFQHVPNSEGPLCCMPITLTIDCRWYDPGLSLTFG